MAIEPRDPNRKCICEDCGDCHFHRDWTFDKNDASGRPTGLKELKVVCSLDVLFDVIPGLIGSVDGCQEASNKTLNRVDKYGKASVQALRIIADNSPKLLNE